MGCSQSSTISEAEAVRQPAQHAHAFPTKEAIMRNPNLRQAHFKTTATSLAPAESPASESAVQKLEDIRRCVLQVGDDRMLECDGPSLQKDYDSWQHEVDAHDLKAMKDGHAVPVNRTADQHLAKKMKSSISELTEDPAKLKRAVQLRRMSREEIAAYRNVLSLNGVEGSKEENKNAKKKATASASPVSFVRILRFPCETAVETEMLSGAAEALVWHLGKVRAKRGAGSSASLSNRPEKEQSLRPSTVAVVQSVSALFRMLWKGVLLPDASGQRELEKICRFRLSLGSERSNYADQHTLMQLRLSFLRPATEQSSKRGMRTKKSQFLPILHSLWTHGWTFPYMAPELFDSKTKITEKIDVWAMGCIFVEICGGPLPYETITTLADLTKEMLIKRRTPDIPEFILGTMREICGRPAPFKQPLTV
ncbi:unnamed protein product [Symbiodinium natans]|uniref:Protein kinase domain-containing protein n=1 Tax=Symbiodinium natans TaxID=878477 RepID=A0A812V6L3_9DINO|nr:unnamed protein product [Symbiodinium natans]